jgi:translation initiation factor IF-2
MDLPQQQPQALGPNEEKVGIIDHYFNHAHIAGIWVQNGRLKIGDRIHIKGHTTDLEEVITSMQVNHVDVKEVGRNAHVGIPIHEKVRPHDRVFVIHQ